MVLNSVRKRRWMSRALVVPRPCRAGPRPGTPALAVAVLFLALGAAFAAPGAGQGSDLFGRVDDEETGRPVADAAVVLVGTPHSTLTDDRGVFRLTGLTAGAYTLRVSHIGYGSRSVEVRVEANAVTRVRLGLTETAIRLEPLDVEALSITESRERGAGYRRSVVTRDQIVLSEGTNMTMADVLRQHVPSVRVRRLEQMVGTEVCIELRTIRTMAERSPCLSPAVYLDGVPVTNPTTLYATLSPRMLERLEVVPAAEAGVRYGSGALYGALLIDSRRPGRAEGEGPRVDAPRAFDWAMDERGHPFARSYLFAFMGNAIGLALGLSAANECIGTRAPSNDRIISRCDTWPTFAAGAAALTLPALGGGFGSGLGGSTPISRGKLLPAAIGGTMAVVPGYALIISGRRSESAGLQVLGGAILVVGVPMVTTLADHLFRSLRERDEPEPASSPVPAPLSR